jgi:hypothetical protein
MSPCARINKESERQLRPVYDGLWSVAMRPEADVAANLDSKPPRYGKRGDVECRLSQALALKILPRVHSTKSERINIWLSSHLVL